MGDTYAGMREYAKLSEEDLAGRIGKSWQTITRLETNNRKTTINRELEQQIVEATGVTNAIFAHILAEKASERLGVQLVVLPPDVLVPSIDLMKAIQMFSAHGYKLEDKERESIKDMLDDMRCHYGQTERLCKSVAKDIIRQINNARLKLGEDPTKDPKR